MASASKVVSKEEIKHILVPKHEKVSESEKKRILEKYNATLNQFPKIPPSDPAIRHLNAKSGDLIKVTRKSSTAGESIYYRGVLSE